MTQITISFGLPRYEHGKQLLYYTGMPTGKNEHASRYLIQLDRPGERLDMAAVQRLLRDIPIEVDADYGPILIAPKLGRYVVRGVATLEARRKAEGIPGVQFFADARVEKAGNS